jgi:hypothetical protein
MIVYNLSLYRKCNSLTYKIKSKQKLKKTVNKREIGGNNLAAAAVLFIPP